jgi:hypothetical protein
METKNAMVEKTIANVADTSGVGGEAFQQAPA